MQRALPRSLGYLLLTWLLCCQPARLAPQQPPAPDGGRGRDAGSPLAQPDAGNADGGERRPTDAGEGSELIPCSATWQCTAVDDAGTIDTVPCFSCPADELCEFYTLANNSGLVSPGVCRQVPTGCALDNICDCLPYFTAARPTGGFSFGYDGGFLADLICYLCAETFPYLDAGPPTVYCEIANL
ncbi:MAG TPA: hypothetical protein VMB50_06130 [Myxococcales bacterium]|nr:hypothetical protein [Myxococcales bacterium]